LKGKDDAAVWGGCTLCAKAADAKRLKAASNGKHLTARAK
jgi:hypothetical protein